MKLHLPKKLFAAVMALFAMHVNTTVGSDIISINFGTTAIPTEATGEVGGVGAAQWVNITGGNADAVNGTYSLTGKGGTTYTDVLTLNTAQSPWGPGGSTDTVLNAMQSSYLDLGSSNTWTITLNMAGVVDTAHTVTDVVLYFSGDGNQYSPVSVGGVNYIGGTDTPAGAATAWGDRSQSASASLGDHNTITVTNVDVATTLTISNVQQGNTQKRATLSGMQIIVTDAYDAVLAAGSNTAESLTWNGPNGFSGAYTSLAAGDRYLRVDVSAGDATLTFASGSEVSTLRAQGGNTLVVNSSGNIVVGTFIADEATTIKLGDIFTDASTLTLAGSGTVELTESQTLTSIEGSCANLAIADGVTVNVSGIDYVGSITGGEGAALNVALVTDASATVNGITVTNKSGTVGINALASGVTDVNCSDGSVIEVVSSGGTLVVNGTTGSTTTISSLAITGNTETKLTAADGVRVVSGSDIGNLVINAQNQALTVGKGVHMTYTGTVSAGSYAINMGNGTLNVAGGTVTATNLIMQDQGQEGSKTSIINITDGGLLEIVGTDDADGIKGTNSVRLAHWGGANSSVNVTNGEFRVLNTSVNLSDDGSGRLNIGADGVANFKGLKVSHNGVVDVQGTLNLGELGLYKPTNGHDGYKLNLNGGTLGSLVDAWTGTADVTVDIAAGSTIQLSKWDVASKSYTDEAANVTLAGTLTGSGSLTLAGNGRLTISDTLANDVSLASGSSATLAVTGIDVLDVEERSGYSGYGDSTTDGYAAQEVYRVAGAGSTLDKVTIVTTNGETTTEAEHTISNGLLTIDKNDAVFFVNTEVERSGITAMKEGTTYVLAENSIYHTNVIDDLGALAEVGTGAVVYLQSDEGKDLLKVTNVTANWKPNMAIEGDSVVSSAGAYTADFTVLSGATLKQTGNDTAGEGYDAAASRIITVQDGGTFDINGYEAYYHIILEQGATLANYGGAVGAGGRNLALVELTGDATVDTETRLGVVFGGYAASELHLNGNTLTKTGSGVFHINNCTTDSGTIRIEEGTVHWLEYYGPAKTTTDATTFVVCSNEDGSVKGTLEFGNEGRTVGAIAGLVADGGIVNVGGSREVTILDSLTGSAFTKKGTGSLALSSGMSVADDIEITVDDGTIVLSNIGIETGKSLTINGAVVADNLCKTGEGSLEIASLSGLISYAATTGNALITTLSGTTAIDVSAVLDSLSSGVNLGIAYTDENISNLTVLGLQADSLEFVNDGNYIKLQTKAGADAVVDATWDINWKGGLLGAPGSLSATTITNSNLSLNLVASEVSGDGGADAVLAGGVALGTDEAGVNMTGDSWVRVTGGTYKAIVGGNACNNWSSNTASNFAGSSHVLVAGGTVNYVIGGNMNDSGGSSFNGDTYVSIMDGTTVNTAVVGASTIAHNKFDIAHTGDTNVFIYTVMENDSGAVVGGCYHIDNAGKAMTLTGNTNVTIDLASYTGIADTFAKGIYGGSRTFTSWGYSATSQISGDTHVNIVGKENIVFSGVVAGGSLTQDTSSSTIAGQTVINISGASSFTNNIVGGNNANGASTNRVGSTSINIAGGTFSSNIVGGDYTLGASTNSVGSTSVNIAGGTFTRATASTVADNPYTNVIAGGHVLAATVAGTNFNADSTSVTVTGGSIAADIFGGHVDMASQSGSHALTATLGSATVTLNGASAQVASIYGGSFTQRDNDSVTMTQGDVVVDLIAGTVNGNVYAGGRQVHSSKISSETTEVRISDAVVFTSDTALVSGGYQIGCTSHARNNPSVVTGSQTLVFNGASQDRSGVSFVDFDTIKVTTAGANATIGTLTTTEAVTKTGAGTLTLAGGTYALSGGLTVSEGGLATSGATALGGALTLADNTALNVSGGTLAIDGALTLGSGLVLTTSELISGDNILISGITSSDITGSVSADTIFASINDLTNLGEHTVKVQDGNLVLSTLFTKELTWDAANDTWKVGSKFGSADADTFANGDSVTFGALTEAIEEVTIDGAVEAGSVSIAAGADKEYSFVSANSGQLTTSTLEIGAGTAKFGDGTLNLSGITTLTVDGTLDVTALSASGFQANNFLALLAEAEGSGKVLLGNGWAANGNYELLTVDVEMASIEFNNHDNSSQTAKLTIGNDFTLTDKLHIARSYEVEVISGGVLSVTNDIDMANGSGTGTLNINGGKVVASAIKTTVASKVNTVKMSGGSLELTGTGGITGANVTISGGELIANTNDWGITGATVGGVKVSGTNTITLSGGTLTSTIDNSAGKLHITGDIDITSEGYMTTEIPSEYSISESSEGYFRTNTAYVVANTAANLMVDEDNTNWTVDGVGDDVTYADGVVTVAGDWGTEFKLVSDKALSSIAKTNGDGEPLTKILLSEHDITLTADETTSATISVQKNATINLYTADTANASNLVLSSSQVDVASSTTATLTGNGLYDLGDVSGLGTGEKDPATNETMNIAWALKNVTLDSENWKGTVRLNGSVGNTTGGPVLGNLGNADSWIEIAESGLTGALNTSSTATVASSLRLTGDMTLTHNRSYAITFTNKVEGEGKVVFQSNQTMAFTGDLSKWTGGFEAGGTENAYVVNLTIGETGKTTSLNADISNNGNGTMNLTTAGTISLTGELTNINMLTNNGALSLSKAAIFAGNVTGDGAITGTALTLQGATNTVGDLTLTGALTLGENVTSLTTGMLDITGNMVVSKLGANILSIAGLTSGLNLSITEEELRTALIGSGLTSLTLGSVQNMNGQSVTLLGIDELNKGQYSYSIDTTGGNLVLKVETNGLTWGGTADDDNKNWSDASNWDENIAPGGDSQPAVKFLGGGSSEVVIGASSVVKHLTIDVAADAAVEEYTFTAAPGSDWNYLDVENNLSVNKGTLNVSAGVNIYSAGSMEVLEGGALNIRQNAFVRALEGIDIAGDVTIDAYSSGGTTTNAGKLYVVNDGNINIAETGNVTVNGILSAVAGGTEKDKTADYEYDSLSYNANGSNITNAGIIASSGTIIACGDLTNSGSLTQTGGKLWVFGTLSNTGAASTETPDAGISIGGGESVLGALDNAGSLSVSGGSLSTGSLENSGALSISGGATVTVGAEGATGDTLENSGTITVGSDAEDTGSLVVNGNLVNSGTDNNIVVNAGSSLAVSGDLEAEGVNLGFAGTVTVGGNATVDELTIEEGASFTANNATIGTLDNDGSLSVGKDVDGTLTGGNLSITTLTGAGDVNVGTGGTLSITNDADFTGKINSEGVIVVKGESTLSAKTDNGGSITTTQLTVKETANGSTLDTLTTGAIVIESMTTEAPSLKLASLNSTTGPVSITLTQMGTTAGVDGIIAEVDAAGEGLSYHLLSITEGSAVELKLTDDAATHQYLLKKGYNHSDLMSTASYDLAAGSTDAFISFWKQSKDEASWDMTGNTTVAGLIVRDENGKLMSEDILDNVQEVVVSGNQSIDLTQTDAAGNDLNRLTLNGLTTADDASVLSILGAGAETDTVTMNGEYDGGLKLNGVTADMDLTGTTVVTEDDTVVLKGTITDGMLEVQQDKAAQGDGLELDDTTLRVVIGSDFTTMSDADLSALESSIVDLGNTTSNGSIEIGTYNADGEFIASAGYEKYFDMSTIKVDDNGNVVADRNDSYYSDNFVAESANGAAGMTLADAALLELNPQLDSDLGQVLSAIETAGSSEKVDELGAALAGASTAALGMAVSGDVDRQLKAIRNRTTTMGVDQSVVNEDMPYFNAWINAEGDRRELNESGTEGGYELNSWGGTVGFDVDFTPTFTAGMALTAMYGDLDVTGADKATGDLDTQYVSVFARYCDSAWTHTFVGTVGMSDISLNRTVAGVDVEGETEGMSFGLMYEVGRVFALNEEGSACLQPVFNVTWKHSSVDGYTEKGSDLALEVDEQTVDTVTFGVGARLQAVVGESMYNRTSILEARVLAKADVGDRNGSADVALAALPGTKAEVESAEMGAFGLEAGAGLTIPVGEEGGSIFMDASVELRSDYTNVNGTVGYRINF